MQLNVPELSLVVLVGPSGCGKSSFASRHFLPTESLSSDYCRALVCDDETSLDASKDAFDALHYIAAKRLARGKLAVVDATNIQPAGRKVLLELARQYHCIPVAIVFDLPKDLCMERNKGRPNRDFGPHVIIQQHRLMKRSLRELKREGFRYVHILRSTNEVDEAEIVRQPLWNNKKHDTGPFDIIGDVHGCFDELQALLTRLGYIIKETPAESGEAQFVVSPPEGRKAIFLGDLVDRGPRIPDVLRLVMPMVSSEKAYCLPGNHDIKLMRVLRGTKVKVTHGLDQSLEQLSRESEEFRTRVSKFIDGLVSHFVLDSGKLVVAHAGMREEMQGRGSGRVREFALYGETTGETDEFGLPVRYKWAEEYRGRALVVYGHTPVPEPEWLNRTVNIDTGCVFGGKLTALRYPEQEIVFVPATKTYAEPARPLATAEPSGGMTAQQQYDDLLHLEDVFGRRIIHTDIFHNVTIREEQAAPALEVMSRFAANPKWLIYLPPTMSPCETSRRFDSLEHPEEAFHYFKKVGVDKIVCEEKHMGSRAIVVVCQHEAAAIRRFGVAGEGVGICYTRTGRRFFTEAETERLFLEELKGALSRADFWNQFKTDWICMDCELMPWSAKARELLRQQYASVGAAARVVLPQTISLLEKTAARGVEGAALLLEQQGKRLDATARYTEAYGRYCWDVAGISDYRLAPFHILATEGSAHTDKDHLWHLGTIKSLVEKGGSPLLQSTAIIEVDVSDTQSVERGTAWWEELTATGGEGMVVKPLAFVPRSDRDLIQPALKCRGREYLRIIYGPEYTLPENIARLRARAVGRKRALALREFALGVESLHRFVRGEPLRRVHECVFGVLALETEPVDPRL